MLKKELRIGLIGCGFMGRTHSNGYARVPNFFPDLEYKPILKAVCSRSEDKVNNGESQHKGNHQQIEIPAPEEPKNVAETCTVYLAQGHFATTALRVERDG